jgi:hypothetical protein
MTEAINAFLRNHHCGIIVDLLKKTGAVVSGSTALYFYMLNCGLLPQFQPADIDIFVTYTHGFPEFNQWFQHIVEAGLLTTKIDITKLKVSLFSGLRRRRKSIDSELSEFVPPPHLDLIDGVRYGMTVSEDPILRPIKIDIICLNDTVKTPIEYVEQYFDLDICKCYYDGTQLVALKPETVRSMSCRVTRQHLSFNRQVSILQLPQYARSIVNNDDSFPDVLDYQKRLRKYRERGFTITIDPHFEIVGAHYLTRTQIPIAQSLMQEDTPQILIKLDDETVSGLIKSVQHDDKNKSGKLQWHTKWSLQLKRAILIHNNEIAHTAVMFNAHTRFLSTTFHDFIMSNHDCLYNLLIAQRRHRGQTYLIALEIEATKINRDDDISESFVKLQNKDDIRHEEDESVSLVGDAAEDEADDLDPSTMFRPLTTRQECFLKCKV